MVWKYERLVSKLNGQTNKEKTHKKEKKDPRFFFFLKKALRKELKLREKKEGKKSIKLKNLKEDWLIADL